jgi:hypothetical protein
MSIKQKHKLKQKTKTTDGCQPPPKQKNKNCLSSFWEMFLNGPEFILHKNQDCQFNIKSALFYIPPVEK